MKDDEEEEEN